MIKFNLNSGVAYSDTDSIFTTDKLPESLLSKELGLMKDKLEGNIIEKAYFLIIKNIGIGLKIIKLIKLLKDL